MALKALVKLLSLVALKSVLSLPLDSAGSGAATQVVWVTAVVTSEVDVLETATISSPSRPATSSAALIIDSSVSSPSSSPPLSSSSLSATFIGTTTWSSPAVSLTQADATPSTNVTPDTAVPAPPSTVTEILTVTATITPPPATATMSESPPTVTDIITVAPTSSTPITGQTVWAPSPHFTDLSSFNVNAVAYGLPNMQIVAGIPAGASASSSAVSAESTSSATDPPPPPTWDNSSSALQLLYPANSINPGQQPQGGSDFYATPLDLSHAQDVSLEYSVFFPVDFDWVRGGKLPGIYGGHAGCSGGDAAIACFSTRLMWRAGGAGELYLYAPKDRQTDSLCHTPPQSVCDAAYGLSVGRGSFCFAAGAWTHVRQSISLNTPGQQDGGFVLEVNGKPVINRSDVFYRDIPPPPPPPPQPPPPPPSDSGDDTPPVETPEPDAPSNNGGLLRGLLGGLLGGGGLFHMIGQRDLVVIPDGPDGILLLPPASQQTPATTTSPLTTTVTMTTTTTTILPPSTTQIVTESPTTTVTTVMYETATPEMMFETGFSFAHAPKPVGFTGLFFSTFFGGHEAEYATPKDQYAWFKDFAMEAS